MGPRYVDNLLRTVRLFVNSKENTLQPPPFCNVYIWIGQLMTIQSHRIID